MTEIRFEGGEAFARAAERLQAAAEGGLQRELSDALMEATKPLDDAARASALENLPRKNGLNKIVAASRISTHRLTALRVRITAHGIPQLAMTNRGMIVHPVYGHRPRVLQKIPKAIGWFYKPMRRGAGGVRRELTNAIERVARRIAG
ncbi:hypothetical protein JOF29_007952 [Kribbella aluminosa]|uniref:HK97 gp10 family phage protein n=1 Tax=Kribbella aluminosa TaxID=416017 RepID=A0ABS4UYY5_9ACTN|nr:hypothetical protein [Kribbella aluminosa]MBP2356842.1 hypothetical protein [Kribbella aluminosa]